MIRSSGVCSQPKRTARQGALGRKSASPELACELVPDLPLVLAWPVGKQVEPDPPDPAAGAFLDRSPRPEAVLLPHRARPPKDLADVLARERPAAADKAHHLGVGADTRELVAVLVAPRHQQ